MENTEFKDTLFGNIEPEPKLKKHSYGFIDTGHYDWRKLDGFDCQHILAWKGDELENASPHTINVDFKGQNMSTAVVQRVDEYGEHITLTLTGSVRLKITLTREQLAEMAKLTNLFR